MRTFSYPAMLERGDRAGGLVVTFRDIPEAITQGDGEEDALARAMDCLDEAIAGRIADGSDPKGFQAGPGRTADPTSRADGCESGSPIGDDRGVPERHTLGAKARMR